MSWILNLESRKIVVASVYLWPSGQRGRIQSQKAQFASREGRTHIPYSLLMWCYYRWCDELMVRDKWRDSWETWLSCLQWYLIIDYCSSLSPGAWGEYISIQNWGRSGMTSCCSVVCCETSHSLGWELGRERRRVLAKITELGRETET